MEFGKSSDVGDFDALMPIELNNRTEIRFTLDHEFTYLPTIGFYEQSVLYALHGTNLRKMQFNISKNFKGFFANIRF